MSDTKHTPGPLKVVMQSTCSGAWPAIVQVCVDPDTGEEWERDLGRCETSHVETDEARNSDELPAGYGEAPHRFKIQPEGEEMIANAVLWAAAPELLEALRAFLRAPSLGSAGPGSVTIAVQDFNLRAARAAIAKATGEPL